MALKKGQKWVLNVHVVFSDQASPRHGRNLAYEVILGGWGDTRSVIRKSIQGPILELENTRDVVQPEGEDYWIRISENRIEAGVGTDVGANLLIALDDPTAMDLNYVGFSSYRNQVIYDSIQIRYESKSETRGKLVSRGEQKLAQVEVITAIARGLFPDVPVVPAYPVYYQRSLLFALCSLR